MIWKALAFLGKIDLYKQHQNYGSHTKKFPAVVKELPEFEFDLQLMTRNVAFIKINNFFQTKF